MYCIQVGKSLLAPVLLSTLFSVRAVILLLCNQLWGKKIPRDHRSKTGPEACLAGALVWSSSLGRVTPLTPASPCLPARSALWQMSPMTGRNNLQLNIPLWSVNVCGGVSLRKTCKDTRSFTHTLTLSHFKSIMRIRGRTAFWCLWNASDNCCRCLCVPCFSSAWSSFC